MDGCNVRTKVVRRESVEMDSVIIRLSLSATKSEKENVVQLSQDDWARSKITSHRDVRRYFVLMKQLQEEAEVRTS